MKKIIITLLVILSACTFQDVPDVCKVQQGVHSWNGFMWPSDNYRLSVYNSAETGDWDESLTRVIGSWNALNTVFTLVEVDSPDNADIHISIIPSDKWLGLAQLWLNPKDGYILTSKVSLNPRLLTQYKPVTVDHVLCQEIGHVLGLFHIVGETCMDDCSKVENGTWIECLEKEELSVPNEDDEEQLVIIYGPPPEMKCD